MRLDKFLTEAIGKTRSQVKKLLKAKNVTVNEEVIIIGKFQVNANEDKVCIAGKRVRYQEFYYLMLNKPKNVVSATTDIHQQTVLFLIRNKVKARKKLFPVGRLDKDTTGLLLLTNDGNFAHELISPKKHVPKTYRAVVAGIADEVTVRQFAAGFSLRNKEPVRPAKLKVLETDVQNKKSKVEVVITEGKYHQVKRMFGAVSMRVLELKRIAIGKLKLDSELKEGDSRFLTEQELNLLKRK
ncbi:pseudouridine synthase [Liquorilactobacillus oeni]|uniref:Pseudouridine synthase n=1 Tax=Liquorilactobacillus oeni DSM 19972 TaxID=1423777 RepID=A0A0R1MKB3_9LACO|nr:pseudouridine synthase [Liquorilactobacillus oeni]KRL04939.1 ribosomal small subunit pseudouridine synthase A [Liquorilactobacillus oeni DSM 19972]